MFFIVTEFTMRMDIVTELSEGW